MAVPKMWDIRAKVTFVRVPADPATTDRWEYLIEQLQPNMGMGVWVVLHHGVASSLDTAVSEGMAVVALCKARIQAAIADVAAHPQFSDNWDLQTGTFLFEGL